METPADSPSSPSDFANVVVSGFDIQASQQDLTASADAAMSAAMDRQSQADANMVTPPGFGEMVVLSGDPSPDWPTDVRN